MASDLKKHDNFTYSGTGNKDDYANTWVLAFFLRRQEWLLEYVKEWYWYDENKGTVNNPSGSEDLIKLFLKRC